MKVSFQPWIVGSFFSLAVDQVYECHKLNAIMLMQSLSQGIFIQDKDMSPFTYISKFEMVC